MDANEKGVGQGKWRGGYTPYGYKSVSKGTLSFKGKPAYDIEIFKAAENVKRIYNRLPNPKVPYDLMDHSYKRTSSDKPSNYLYPHSFGCYAKQQYLLDKLKDRVYCTPSKNGKEAEVLIRKFQETDKE